jgi:hypothetical protein
VATQVFADEELAHLREFPLQIGQAVSGMEAARARSAASVWNVERRTPTRLLDPEGVGGEGERAGQQKP